MMDGLSNSARGRSRRAPIGCRGWQRKFEDAETTEALEASREAMGANRRSNTIIGDRIHRLSTRVARPHLGRRHYATDTSRIDWTLLMPNAAPNRARARVGNISRLLPRDEAVAENVTGSTSQIKATVQEIQHIPRRPSKGSGSLRRIGRVLNKPSACRAQFGRCSSSFRSRARARSSYP